MTIESDPKPDTIDDSDDAFEKAFAEFASGETPDPDPVEDEKEDDAPDGNGPEEEEPEAPAEAAADEDSEEEEATSGDAEKPDGGQPSAQEPDPWAGLPPELKARIEQIEREKDEALHRASSDANRVAALSRKLHQLQSGQSSSGNKPQDKQPSEAEKALEAKIKTLREEYPEIAEPMIELLERQKQELTSVKTVLDGMTETQMAQAVAQEAQALEAMHPDWRTVAQSGDFAGWLSAQPDNIQRLANSWDARETSVVLSLFKSERVGASEARAEPEPQSGGTPQPTTSAATGARRSQQLDGGRDVRSRPAPAASGPPQDFDAAFNYFVEKRRLASRR